MKAERASSRREERRRSSSSSKREVKFYFKTVEKLRKILEVRSILYGSHVARRFEEQILKKKTIIIKHLWGARASVIQ